MLDTPAEPVASPPPADEAAPAAPPPSDEAAPAAHPAPPATAAAPPDLFAVPPVSPDDPCGPDLDLEGDPDFLNFLAATEGLLPANYYSFNRESIDFPGSIETAEKLLKRTLDVRLVALLAKLSILNRDLKGFARRIGGLAWLLREHWEGANPRADGGDYSVRLGQLMTLEENPVVLMPLQYAPLLESAREGALAYRDQLLATGAAQPRSVTRFNEKGEQETSVDEKFMPKNAIERLLREVDIQRLVALVETLRGITAALQTIKAATVEHVGYKNAVELPKLDKLVSEMTEFLRAALIARDPSFAPPQEAAAGAVEEGAPAPSAAAPAAFATRAEVDAALAAALGYFMASEPTSPALLLIRQARATLGKNLYEVMQLLAPPHADNARVFVGPEGAFTVPVRSLADAPSEEFERASSEPVEFPRRGSGADRCGRPAHAARRAVEPCPLSARPGAEPRLARLRQPAP